MDLLEFRDPSKYMPLYLLAYKLGSWRAQYTSKEHGCSVATNNELLHWYSINDAPIPDDQLNEGSPNNGAGHVNKTVCTRACVVLLARLLLALNVSDAGVCT
jgi:hypothetical protein